MECRGSTDSHGAPPLGVKCFSGDLPTAARSVVKRACDGQGGYACLGNAHVLVTAKHDSMLPDALEGAWQVFPDGASVAWLQRWTGHPFATRIGGPDLMALVCTEGVPFGLRHFLLGSTEGVLSRLRANLEQNHTGIKIVGSYSPSRREIESDVHLLVDRISPGDAQIIWCALGAPRQEIWMARASSAAQPSLLVGVGAAFDFISETKPRAPNWMQRSGLEWGASACNRAEAIGRALCANQQRVCRARHSADRGSKARAQELSSDASRRA